MNPNPGGPTHPLRPRSSFLSVAMFAPSAPVRIAGLALLSLAMLLGTEGCRRLDPPTVTEQPRTGTVDDGSYLNYLRPEAIGAPAGEHPWIAHVLAVDLDRDGLLDVVACDTGENNVVWIRQVARGRFEEIVLARDLLAPVHVEAVDLDGDGDLDLLVSCMGFVFPNNDKIGSVVALENDGQQHFTPHVLLANTSRVTDIRAADLNGDGQLDLVVGQFGYDQGEIRWMERIGPWEFKSHIILDLSGTINVLVADFNGDGRPDIVGLVSQQWEQVWYFQNEGGGNFTRKIVWGSTNEDYGSSGISLGDLNGDGRPDVVYSNGDGFGPAVVPGPRPWHGVQWLENTGGGGFRFHRIGNLPGAYSPVAVDLDGDGKMDVVAGSAYVDWDPARPKAVSLMWFHNEGTKGFAPRALAQAPKDLITVAAGDFDGDGRSEIVTGGFYVAAPYDRLSRITLWRRQP